MTPLYCLLRISTFFSLAMVRSSFRHSYFIFIIPSTIHLHRFFFILADVRRELEAQRTSMDGTMWPLESLTRELRSRVSEAKQLANTVEDAVQDVEQWRWLSLLGELILDYRLLV